MATEDFGIKFDLFHEQKLGKTLDLDLIRDLGDSFIDFDIDNTTVPDISDQFFNFDPAHIDEHSSQLDCDELLSNLTSSDCCKKHEIDLDLDSLDSGDPLRHDCMWSGLCPSEEHRNIAKKDQLPSSSTSSSSSSVNSVFDTPLQSDFETSDMDETFSEASSDAAEADPEPIQKMPSVTMDHMYGDHCYTSCQPAPVSSSVTLKPTSIAKIRDTETPRDRVTIKSPAVTSRAKFRFQMKFLTGRSNTRPLLAHPSRINRTHYHKRKAAIKNSFCQSPMKSIQVRIYSHLIVVPMFGEFQTVFLLLRYCRRSAVVHFYENLRDRVLSLDGNLVGW